MALHNLKIVVKDTIAHMRQAQLGLVASSLAYTTILSLIPMLALAFAIFQGFGGLHALGDSVIKPFIISNLAEGVSDEVVARIDGFVGNVHASAIGVGGLVGLIFTTMSMLSSVEKAINRVWHAPLNRSLFQRVSAYWLFITLGPIALAVLVGAATSLHMPVAVFLPGSVGALALTTTFFFAIYKWVPHAEVRSRCALVAALLIAVVFAGTQAGFRYYTAHVLSYSKIYGSLAAVPILLLWIYIVWIVVLSGAAFTAALQKRYEVLHKPRPSPDVLPLDEPKA